LIDFCESLCYEEFGVHIVENTPISMPKAKNRLLKMVEEDFVCIVPPNLLVNKFWLEQLYFTYTATINAGVLSIRSGKEKLEISPFLRTYDSEDDILDNGWFHKDNSIEGILFFERAILNEVGYYDEELDAKGLEDKHFTFRCGALGHTNLYISKHSLVKIPTDNKVLFPEVSVEGLRNFRDSINEMTKTNNYKK